MKRRPHRPAVADPQSTARLLSRRALLKSAVIISVSSLAGFGFWEGTLHARKNPHRPKGDTFPCTSGPWGQLECERINIEVPDECISVAAYSKPMQWFFKDYSRAQVFDFFTSIGMTDDQLNLVHEGDWKVLDNGIIYTPTTEFVRSLSETTRGKVYELLASFPEYGRYFDIFVFEPKNITQQLQNSGLSEQTADLFRKLLYPRGDVLAFSDVPAVFQTLKDDADKLRFLKTIMRRQSLIVRLKIDSQSNIDELARYWGANGRRAVVQARLEAAARVRGGSEIDISDLLPPFVSAHINILPRSSDSAASVENCHWTALNFFNERPVAAYLDPNEAEKAMGAGYTRVKSQPQVGDLIVLRTATHEIVHSASYIADNIIFTKNGQGMSQPWTLLPVQEVIHSYSALMGPVTAMIYRRNSIV